jgi:hypothetical protein
LLFVFEGSKGSARDGLEVELFPFAVWSKWSSLGLIGFLLIVTSVEVVSPFRYVPPDVAKIVSHSRHDVVEASTISSFEVFEPVICG